MTAADAKDKVGCGRRLYFKHGDHAARCGVVLEHEDRSEPPGRALCGACLADLTAAMVRLGRAQAANDDQPYVCPGCYAVGEDPCAPGCIDAEIEAQHRDAIESGDYDRREDEPYDVDDDDGREQAR